MAGGSTGAAWRGFALAARHWNQRTGTALQQAGVSEVEQGQAALQVAVGALRTTAAALANRLRAPAPAPAPPRKVPSLAALAGTLPALGVASVLRATRAVNENPTAVRQSAHALGLDVTSAEGPSRLTGLAGIGLDVTSPEAPSVLEGTAALGLDVTSAEAVSTLVSTGEANAALTSYGVVQATFVRGSNPQGSLGQLTGVYAGTGAASTATSLRIRIDSPDTTVGNLPTAVSLRVFNQNGVSLGSFSSVVTAGQSVSLGADIGLSIAFTEGSLLRNAETTLAVSNTTPTDVNPDAAFNHADVNLRPRFENGRQVTAGSFTVNGTVVSVLAGDTIHTVLNRLNATVAGVSASFSGDQVQLQSTGASEDDLILGNDTSGFLAALKLEGAVTTRGNVRDDRQTLAKTAAFAAVTSGSFTVGGQVIAVDAATDTLAAVLDRIHASGAGVTASYDAATDRVQLVGDAPGEDDIVVGGDDTGLLAALRLDGAVTVRGNLPDDTQPLARVAAFAGVTAGTFRVNGVAIALDPSVDTLLAVLGRVQAAGAGVTAAYDPAVDRVSLETAGNSEEDIELTEDGTGFLAAAGLAGGVTERGRVRDDRRGLAGVAAFAGVTAGSFEVNGALISVDPLVDSLEGILARVNGAGAGVTAAYDAGLDRVVFTPVAAGSPLALGGDTTGFLAAAGLATGSQGTAVNPEAAFNGTGLAAPFFEEGHAVGAGRFRVNEVVIEVAADDTLQAVLARITQSAAGVTAAFDAATERVTLTAKGVGSAPITVGEDTSGFLAAVKLDGTAESVAGQGALAATLSSQPALAGVVSGVVTINGRAVAVNPATQTLAAVAAALEGLAGVRFTLEEATGKVLLQAEQAGESLDVADTSGLLAALGIASGRVAGTAARPARGVWPSPPVLRPGLGAVDARGLAENVAGVLGDLNDAVAWIAFASDGAVAFQNDVFAAVRGAAAGLGGRGVALEETSGLLQLGTDAVGLETVLRTDARALADFLGGEGGLVTALEAVLQAYGRNAEAMREPSAYTVVQARRAYGF